MQGGFDKETAMMAPVSEAAFSLHEAADGRRTLALSGDWTLVILIMFCNTLSIHAF